MEQRNDLIMGTYSFYLSPILLDPPANFQEWLDGVTHFTDVLLFVSRSNDNQHHQGYSG